MLLKLSKELDLEEIRVMSNIATELSEEDLIKIGHLVKKGFEEDKTSRNEWEKQVDKALELAELKLDSKDFPYKNSANVKYPLLTTANIQFAARTYPEIVRNGKVVEVATIGKDPEGKKQDRAKRIAEHMSYQLLVESDEWEQDTDKLLHVLPTVGTVFKKTYFDPIKGMNCSQLCLHNEIIVNDNIASLRDASRISHLLYKNRNKLVELSRAGYYLEDDIVMTRVSMDDLDKDVCLIEQHRGLDLDGDGYDEPYIVTTDLESDRVLRIVARFDADGIERLQDKTIISIKGIEYFTDFHFIPSPSGKFHSIGFGHLLTPLNASVNTILNQLLDAGTLANVQGGFISSKLRSKEKDIRLKMGEFKVLNISGDSKLGDNIFPMQYKEPSNVLFQLLGMLIQATKELSSVTDALTGAQDGQNVPATTMLALVEQGLKVFTSIQRRLYRGFKKEFEKLYRLNRIYLEPSIYQTTMDDPEAILSSDYEEKSFDIKPVSDPNLSSDAQRLARTKIILELMQNGYIDRVEGTKEYLENLDMPNIEKLMPKEQGPDIKMLELQAQVQKDQASLKLQEKDLYIRALEAEVRTTKAQADVTKTLADAMLSEAKAQELQVNAEVNKQKLELDAMKLSFQQIEKEMKAVLADKEMMASQAPAAPTPPETGVSNDANIEIPATGLAPAPSDAGAVPPVEGGEI